MYVKFIMGVAKTWRGEGLTIYTNDKSCALEVPFFKLFFFLSFVPLSSGIDSPT